MSESESPPATGRLGDVHLDRDATGGGGNDADNVLVLPSSNGPAAATSTADVTTGKQTPN